MTNGEWLRLARELLGSGTTSGIAFDPARDGRDFGAAVLWLRVPLPDGEHVLHVFADTWKAAIEKAWADLHPDEETPSMEPPVHHNCRCAPLNVDAGTGEA